MTSQESTPTDGTAAPSSGTGTVATGTAPGTDPGFVTETRVFYDAVAEDYATVFRHELEQKPLDRAVLRGFAELVLADGGGEVADLGCGPGRVAGYLASLGVSVFGLDLSRSMLAVARRENPGLRFESGSMLELTLPDASLAGVMAWYSTIHTPDERLPELFAGFRRVLRPGGHLLLGFQVGDVPKRRENPYGHQVSLDFRRRRPGAVAALLEEAGFEPVWRVERARALQEPTSQAALLVRRPAGPAD
ncbi:class I SAM-dependent DNA methyltransferase [Streptomyces sp. NPDC090306]|uniref:class I SAM-dependent DNA methyltransferase n=1 Tax=Streptomyces sp. NPDC090306 TaxID=3365961 RepID=UPI00382AD9EE